VGVTRFLAAVVVLAGLATTGAALAGSDPRAVKSDHLKIEARVGDFDMMMERRTIRVLVPYSRTLYFSDKGRERGITAETVRDFEEFLNRKHRRALRGRPVTVLLVPTPRDQLFARVAQGLGDIAAGNLTATFERTFLVDFFVPGDMKDVSELVLTGKRYGPLSGTDELAGKVVAVRPSSSYFASLQSLNERFQAEGKPPVTIERVDEALEDEDLMEMLDAGVIDATVVDSWKARMWAKVLPGVLVNESAAVRTGGQTGWAVRKNSPLLMAELAAYYADQKKGGEIAYRLVQYNKKVKRLQDPTGGEDWKRFRQTIALFEKYGATYGFDPLLLAAQGFQESRLDQNVRSPVGAIGIMQVMPKTGASMRVGDVTVTEPNIHAGAKYMNTMMTTYFPDAHLDELNRTLFAFASYNAGPSRIARLRSLAAERGLDPDRWFDNVEVIVSEKVGRETTTYVRNILKYYVSYRLMLERQKAQDAAREQHAPTGD
jgi:membrane-bound lytic murein transglycosylase MltF